MQTKNFSRKIIASAIGPVLETLECKKFLTVTSGVDTWSWREGPDGTGPVHTEVVLRVQGDDGNDVIDVESGIAAGWNGEPLFETIVSIGSASEQTFTQKFSRIVIDAGDGTNKITFTGTGLVMIGTRVSLNDGEGNSQIKFSSDTHVSADGGDGDDIITATSTKLNRRVGHNLFGGNGNDVIKGGSGSDYLNGGAGDDKLYGNKGYDTLEGGDGNDFLSGGADGDTLYTSMGKDILNGDGGYDTFRIGWFHEGATDDQGDTLNGGSSKDAFAYNAVGELLFHTQKSIEFKYNVNDGGGKG